MPDEGGDVPGQRRGEDEDDAAGEGHPREAAEAAAGHQRREEGAPGEREPDRALGHGGERGEEEGAEVADPIEPPLGPVGDDHEGERRRPHQRLERRGELGEEGRVEDAGRVAGDVAVARRSRPEADRPATCTPRPGPKSEVPRDQVEDLRDDGEGRPREDEVYGAEVDDPGAGADGHRGRLLARLRGRGGEEQAEHRGEGTHEGHVGGRLARHQEELRHGPEHQRREEPRPPAEGAGDAPVEEGEARHREEERRQAQRPLGPRGEPRERGEHRPRLGVDAERAHGERLEPEVEHGLRPEPAILCPPGGDPVAAGDHLAGDLAVVRLPGVDQRGAPEEGQVEERRPGHDPGAVPVEETEAATSGRDDQEEGERHDDGGGPDAEPAGDREAEGDEEEDQRPARRGCFAVSRPGFVASQRTWRFPPITRLSPSCGPWTGRRAWPSQGRWSKP